MEVINTALSDCDPSMPIAVINPVLILTFLLIWAVIGQMSAGANQP